MLQGTVKWFNQKKGFGFLICKEIDKDVFVHYSNIQGKGFRTLQENDLVEFEIQDSARGPTAVNVIRK